MSLTQFAYINLLFHVEHLLVNVFFSTDFCIRKTMFKVLIATKLKRISKTGSLQGADELKVDNVLVLGYPELET